MPPNWEHIQGSFSDTGSAGHMALAGAALAGSLSPGEGAACPPQSELFVGHLPAPAPAPHTDTAWAALQPALVPLQAFSSPSALLCLKQSLDPIYIQEFAWAIELFFVEQLCSVLLMTV